MFWYGMAVIKSDSTFCALCTKHTQSVHPISKEDEEDGGGHELVKKFNCEFNLLPIGLIDNWSLCQNCLPDVQSALQSKENVDKVECQVRRLQVEILDLLKNLAVGTGRMYEDLRKIQQIVGRRPSSVKMQMEDTELIGILKERISYVVRDLEEFSKSTLNKVLDNVEPSIKVELEHEMDLGTSQDEPNSPVNCSPVVSVDDCELTQNVIQVQRKSQRIKTKRRKSKKIKATNLKPEVNSSDDDNDIDNQVENSDEDFDPHDAEIRTCGKTVGWFRKHLIKRIREARTISTSKILPSSETDPRRPYSIKYIKSTNQFLVENFEFLVNEQLKSLECASCDFTIDKSKLKMKSCQLEDAIFDHILGKHLKLYSCPICGIYFDLFAYMKPHYKAVHQKDEEAAKKFVCEICEKPVSNNNSLREHQWTHLNDEERKLPENLKFMPIQWKKIQIDGVKFECNICGHLSRNKAHLQMHQRKHLKKEEREDEKVICSFCGLAMFETSLNSHLKRCEEQQRKMEKKLVKCVVCGVTLKSNRELDKHKKRNHPDDKVHECKICGKWFGSLGSLIGHQISHETERKHVCDRCGMRYKRKSGLGRHLKNSCGKN